MIRQHILSLVCFIVSQQEVAGFVLAPGINNLRNPGVLFASENSGSEDGSSPQKPSEKNNDEKETTVRKNDLSMFLADENDKEEAKKDRLDGFDPLEFFMTQDESIQRLEEVEEFFRQEPIGIMMEEQTGVLPTETTKQRQKRAVLYTPATNKKVTSEHHTPLRTRDTGIGIDEEYAGKKVMYYDYDGSLSKIKRNLGDNPVHYYSE